MHVYLIGPAQKLVNHFEVDRLPVIGYAWSHLCLIWPNGLFVSFEPKNSWNIYLTSEPLRTVTHRNTYYILWWKFKSWFTTMWVMDHLDTAMTHAVHPRIRGIGVDVNTIETRTGDACSTRSTG